VKVNGEEVDSAELSLLLGDEFVPLAIDEEVPADGSVLSMRLYAGLVRLGDEAEDDTDDPDRFLEESPAGWYLFCNDRLLIARDKSHLTGWGEAVASYHPQYRQFRGYVFLDGDSRHMPWTTTKTSVDEDSAVFRAVQSEMFDALQKAVAVMNRLKRERQQRPEGERPAVAAMAAARPAPLNDLPESRTFVLPKAPPAAPTKTRWIRYTVDRDDFEAVAAEIGTDSAPDVGKETFRFYYDAHVAD
jgi:hypothetical protein